MDDARYKAAIDARLSRGRRGLLDYIDSEISDIRGELLYLNAARKSGALRPRELIQKAIESRRTRSRFFPKDIFADPAWDILLTLALAKLDSRRVAIKEAALAAAVPTTTALRWLATLDHSGMIERAADPDDGRRVFIALSPAGWEAMAAWMEYTMG